MALRTTKESFEGSFDLLLYLVSRKKVDIGAISISEITDQYLAEISKMDFIDLDTASDFLIVATTLLEIKANSLSPKKEEVLDDDDLQMEPDQLRQILIDRLIEYKQFKNVSMDLASRFNRVSRMHGRPFGPDMDFLKATPDYLEDVSLSDLGILAANAMARREIFLLESEHIAAKPIPVEVHVREIRRRLTTQRHLRFSDLITHDQPKEIVVVTFLALLELYKRKIVDLKQASAFGDIDIDYISDAE